ncbi:hypothetical protein [Chengkuizengella axinellae]|uniref:CobQ/CobB/MinD/ParA nucleotide binding domain-containing protein n=1 Tax=Chengkuizengella axinellae TaxID=3064388 RepID=A0ABT9J3F9_9BACL|nr:hypothetical protein [Chengkuizengella sp. 2205SS18-9]MDP5276128.1 hypothetical protein [Chengkuizengella sp. 2205SS18-9]
MKLYIQADEMVKRMFDSRYEMTDSIHDTDVKIIVVVRSNEQDPQTINYLIRETEGMVPFVVLTGEEDDIGVRYLEVSKLAGVPEDFILTGTEWRMSKIKEVIEKLLKDPALPDPKVFMDYVQPINQTSTNEAYREIAITTEQVEPIQTELNVVTENQIISVLGFNGGVGLSTVSASLSAFYHARGLNSRLIDLSKHGESSIHFDTEKSEGIHSSEYGDIAITKQNAEVINEALNTPANVIVVDLPNQNQHFKQMIELSSKVIVVLNPSESDYNKLKEHVDLLDMSKVVIVMNKADATKPLRHSFITLVEQDFNNPIIVIEDSDEVASSYAERKPAHLRYPFDVSIAELASQLEID